MDFSELAQNIQDIFSQRQKALLFSSILGIFFCAALIAVVLIPQNKKAPAPVQIKSEPLKADQALLLPQGVSIPQDYAVSRETRERWTQGQALEWLYAPDEAAVEALSRANDALVKSVTEAAP